MNGAPPPMFHFHDPALRRRDEVYLAILRTGLDHIRAAAWLADTQHCHVEADHLHNLPQYIAGGDAAHHLYYLTKEVPFYLSRVERTVDTNMAVLLRYAPLWRELERLVPIEGSPWAAEWLAMKARGWDYELPGA